MKKIYYFLMAVCLLTVNVAYAQEVTESDLVQDQNGYYLIDTPEKLVYIANFASNENPDINIKITADLDMSEVSDQYVPISGGYSGIFDGGGHTISNLVINKPDEDRQGLIGVAGNCTIKNLTLDNTCRIEGARFCGGFVGATSANENVTITMENLIMHGDVKANRNAAGIYGCNENSKATVIMKNCGVSGYIVATNEWQPEAGAMSGWLGNNATLVNCWFLGTIEGHSGENDAFCRGGNATLTNCYSVIGQKPGVTNISAEAAASGELTWKLNGQKSSDIIWYQTLGEDQFPVLDNTHKTVYANGKSCDGISGLTYNNEGGKVEIIDHEYNETGFCGNCGASDPNFEPQIEYVLVNTPSELVSIANYATKNPTVNIKITADLDMSEVSDQYVPISGGYSGIFDGGGHTISNLIINKPREKAQALIGVAGECTIKNLTLDETCSITGGEMCAGFVGVPSGGSITMENLVMQGNVKGERNTAGIFACNEWGRAQVTMTNCGVSGNIEGGYENGAMSGYSGNAVVTNCWFVGTIEGYEFESNLFCRGSATLTNCYSSVGNQYGVTNISADAAASGELTWKLNGEKSTDVTWYQTIGKDLCPTLNSDHGIVSLSNDGSYISQKTVEIKISEENEWITYMQPFATELPTGVQAFTADGVNGDYLILKEASSLNANTPYILYAEDGHESSQTGTMEVADGKAVKAGVLSGALDAQQITSGYVLQNQGDGAMFYKVNESITVPSGKCWLDLSSDKKAIRIHNNGANGIDGIEHKLEEKGIYTIDGKAVSNPQSGKIYVIDGKKVMKL